MKGRAGVESITGFSLRAMITGIAASRMIPAPIANGRMPSDPISEKISGPAAKPSDSTVA